MGTGAAPMGASRRLAIAAVVLCSALLGMAGCEYTYDDARAPLPSVSAPSSPPPTLPQDPALNTPVTGQELKAWAEEAVPAAEGQTFYSSYGFMEAQATRTEESVQLPEGLYSVTLACRSTRRVSFTVSLGNPVPVPTQQPSSPPRTADPNALVDLALQCGTARVNVIQLTKSSVLSITVRSSRSANFAYRVNRI